MSFDTFTITELPDDADNDFRIEMTMPETHVRVTMSREELEGVGKGMVEAANGDMESWDGKKASEVDP